MEDGEIELLSKLDEKIKEGNELIGKLQNFMSIPGVGKLQKRIEKEIKFLLKFKQKPTGLKIEHLQCSNLLHLSAIVQALMEASKPCTVLKTVTNADGKKVVIDIVTDEGFQWIKVIARSPQALERLSGGDQAYGQRSLIDQANEYILATKCNIHHFKPPSLVFLFHSGVPENAVAKLSAMGIIVQGEIVPTSINEDDTTDESDDNEDEISDENSFCQRNAGNNYDVDYSTLNLDITAMIAYVSAVSNGYANYVFEEKILTQQAAWERQRPVKPMLDELFHNKQLITCQSAMDDFMTILGTLGGEGEKIRAKELTLRIKVIPDQISDKVQKLKTGGKVRERSKVIFGTGDYLKVVTVSANSGFSRAAQSQNITLAVISHESRALTESKMKTATKIAATP